MWAALLHPHLHLAARRAAAQGSHAKTGSSAEKAVGREAAVPPKGAAQIGPTANLPRATSQARRASLQVGAAHVEKAPALLYHPVPEEEGAVRARWGVATDSRGMTATPGGGLPSKARAPIGMCHAAAGKDRTARMAADTGPPALRGTAART